MCAVTGAWITGAWPKSCSIITDAGYARVRPRHLATDRELSPVSGPNEEPFVSFSLREPGLLISSVAHVAVLVGGLVTFSGEAPFPDADEGIPVTFITEEQFSQAARGEPDARREDEPTAACGPDRRNGE